MCRAQQSGGTFKSRKAASIMEFLSMPKNGFNHVQKWGANDGEIDCYHTEPVYNEIKCLRLTKAILTNKYRRFESQQFWKGNKTTRKKHEIRHFFFSSLVVFSLFWGRTKLFTRLDSRSSKLMFHFFSHSFAETINGSQFDSILAAKDYDDYLRNQWSAGCLEWDAEGCYDCDKHRCLAWRW